LKKGSTGHYLCDISMAREAPYLQAIKYNSWRHFTLCCQSMASLEVACDTPQIHSYRSYLSVPDGLPRESLQILCSYHWHWHCCCGRDPHRSIISGCFRLDVSTKNIVWASSKRVKKYEMGVCGSVIIFVWGLMAWLIVSFMPIRGTTGTNE